MAYIETLPILEGAKVIVIDEGLDVMYAGALIAGWLQAWKEKDLNYSIDWLSFSDPKLWYENEPGPFTSKNVHLHDYYTVNVNEVAKKDLKNLEYILKTVKLKPRNTVIVNCLSSLVLYVGLAKALRFIEQLSKQVSQLICIYRRDLVQKIPAVETLGTAYVKLEKFTGINSTNNLIYTARLIFRKLSSSLICQTEIIKQDSISYQIYAEKIATTNGRKSEVNENQSVKIESSFRIEMNAREMEQRDKTPLPYTLNATNTSKIFYHPDDVDDIDEEDPDDDLCF
ncbi:elongator complex protein 5 [Nylanderia fulva]|uniref:elongator complex protein 5 n=1 Tax=Nylanderia fulva TaxID=613905 RepID=UPI0010FB79E1|nr:elongator complex protein 5 [Nylanderia fulva]XP_029156539.1 elongator complex protein 5 [Nylanderia fulva]XP_029156540.1 elongator complex protein 5 [Nylanderia fulva]